MAKRRCHEISLASVPGLAELVVVLKGIGSGLALAGHASGLTEARGIKLMS